MNKANYMNLFFQKKNIRNSIKLCTSYIMDMSWYNFLGLKKYYIILVSYFTLGAGIYDLFYT